MKDFRGMIDRYLLDHEQQKKYLAIVLALSMLVTFAVPLSLMQNAESTTVKPVFTTQLANAVGNATLHPLSCTDASCTDSSHMYSEVDLLVGKNSELRGATIEETIRNANATYAIGIASQFCVFLNGDFTTTDADAEGRVAVSGSVDGASWNNNTWYYEIGNGDWYTRVGLDVLLNDSGYAHVISNGSNFQHVNVSSGQAANDHPNGSVQGKHYSDANGNRGEIFKRFQIGNNTSITGYNDSTDMAHFYRTDTFSVAEQFGTEDDKKMLLQRSEKLSQKTANGEITFGEISDNGSTVKVAYLTYTGTDPNAESIFFNFDTDQWSKFVECTHVKYQNIPLLNEPREVVENDGSTSTWDTAYIVINVPGTEVHLANPNTHNGQKFTSVTAYGSTEEKWISRTGTGDNDYSANNHPGVSSLLYNFYQAEKLVIANNFQGTLLAPMAHATDEYTEMNSSDANKRGHLSGALIAKSFDGATEFGYRPYTGPISILGSTSGYPVPMSKFKEDGITPLAGAGFTLKKGEEIVESWTSDGSNKPQYITIPTAVDYDGGTNYNTAITDITTTYTMQEASPPEGYIGTDDQYTITVQEVIDPSGLIKADETSENTIPTKVQVTITVVGPGGDEVLNTTMTVTDTYDTESNQQTRRAIELNGNTYYLDMTNGKITSINKPTGEMTDSSYESNGTIAYTETADATEKIVHYYPQTEVSSTEVPVTLENGEASLNEASETVMTRVPATTAVDAVDANGVPYTSYSTLTQVVTETVTKTVAVIDENQNPVTTDGGSTVVEVIVESSTLTETSIEVSGYTTEYDATKDTTYVVFTSVTVVESVVDPTTVTTSGTITLDGKDYYFDPDSMMLMPVPDTVPSFTNRYGYVFEKNDGSEPLSSADMVNAVIYLEKKDGDNYSQIKQITSSRITLEPDELTENTLYRFNEQTPPSGYEQADPVYMVKSGGKIYWLSSAEEPSVDTVKNSLDNFTITDDNLDNRTIEMKDQKIYGAKVKLQKTDVTGTTKLTGAYFRLLTGNTKVYPVDNWNEGFRIDEELDLFEVLKAAAPESYDENYVQDGYLKKGTYSLEEVTAPGGYQTPAKPYKFKIELDNGNYTIVPLSSDAPEYITFTASTAWGKEIWAYGSATDVTKIEVEVTSPADGSTLILYEDPVKTSLHGKSAPVVGGVATFTEVPNAIGNFKVQNQGYNTGVTVKEVRVYGTASDGGSTATTYTYGQTAWNDNNADTIRISTFTVYYDDGTQEIVENPTHGNQGDHWMPVNISLNKKDGIVGIEIVTTGSGTRKLMIQASDNSTAIYTQDMTAGETYIFGTIPTDSPTDTDDTTQNTESTNSMPLTVTGNTISIPNELMGAKTDITVQKDWEKDELYSSVTRPDKITVQLYQATTQEQMTNNQGTAYGDPVEITPNTDGEWTHTWSQIPNQVTNTDGSVTTYLYYAREVSTPSGYTVSYPDDGKTIIHITNTLNTISLTAHKKWVDSKGNAITSNSIPGVTLPEISVKLQYSENGTDGWKDLPNSTQTLNASNSWTYNYKDIPSGYTYKMVERDVPDGWTVGESTTTNQNNGTVEIENKLQTGSLQVTKKWSGDESDTSTRPGSITVNVYRKEVVNSGTTGGSAEDDITGGNTEVSEDAVVARFLYQKGNGYTDHDTYWGPPESQPSRANQMYWTTNSASDIAANYAAALAQFAVNFPGDDKSENYLNAAKALYDFSTKYNSCATEHCSGFYPSTSCTDEQAWAAAWLYLATKDPTYKTDCKTKLDQLQYTALDNRGYFWDDVILGAEAVYAAHIDNSHSWDKVTGYLTPRCQGNTLVGLDANDWGTARHNALLQTLALVTDKNRGTTQYQEWCKQQMSLILGNNTYGKDGAAVNLVIGFADNSVKNPHHKAATGEILVDTANNVKWDDIWNKWDGVLGEKSHVLVGALASGPRGGKVTDNCRDHTGNEVALDYNAGLVGAAAGLYSVYGTGTLVNNGADIDSEVESKYDGFAVTRQPAYTSNITEDYSRLLQYSLYFYDANMCGDFTAENSAFSWRPACHTDDEVDGGFHDAGDHVMFGLPQGFSASTLGWVYYEFRDSFDSLGQTAHYKTIMEEFCDFFVDSIEFEKPSQQTLTLSNTQSQKASAIKGISVVGSDVKAKGAEQYVTLSNPVVQNHSVYDVSTTLAQLPSDATLIRVEFDFTGTSYNGTIHFTDDSGGWNGLSTQLGNTATINITGSYNSNYKYICIHEWSSFNYSLAEIRFYYQAAGPVFGLKTTSATLKLGERITLETENATDGGTVSWTSSNPDYVTIANGVVQAVKYTPNEVTITAKDESTGSTATAKITVSPMTISSITSTSLNIGDTTTITLGNPGFGTIQWKVTDANGVASDIATVTNFDNTTATITAKKGGDFYVVAADANGNSVKTSSPIHVNGPSIKAPTGITEYQTGIITIGGLTGSYTVKFGDTELTGSNHTYSFTAPGVDKATDYTVAVLVNGETVANTTVKVNPFAITQEGAVVSEGGGTATFNANAPAEWSLKGDYSNNITLTPSSDGMSCEVKGGEYTADTITVIASDGKGNSDEAGITMSVNNNLTLSIADNKTTVRVGGTVTLQSNFGSNVAFSFNPADLVRFDEATRTVTALGAGTVQISATRYGASATPVTLTIKEALTITGDPTMNIDETQTLTANGAIGTITWAISGEDEGIVTLDAATGEVTAEKNGNVTIIATDNHDNAVAEFTISVELTAANANIPSGAELIGQIEVKLDTATGEWTKNEGLNGFDPENLPLCSPNGNPYEYYIEEVLTDGVVSGNSASYVPIEYLGSGVQLANGSAAAMSVENKLKSSTETTGTLPSTGGGGVKIYYAAGLVMMLSGIAGYFVTKRRRNSQS